MKFTFNFMFLISFFVFLIKINYSVRLSAKAKGDDMNLDPKEIEAMLKDPKFANIAGDLEKLKTSRAQMEQTGKELKGMGVDPLTHKKIEGGAAAPSPSAGASAGKDALAGLGGAEKDALAGLGGAGKDALAGLGGADLAGLGLGGAGKDPMAGLGAGALAGLGGGPGGADPLKDLGLGGDIMGGAVAAHHSRPRETKPQVDEKPKDKFKDFDFISKQQAKLLLEILKQPTFFNMLPKDAQQVVKGVTDGFAFKTEENYKINDFIDMSLTNTPNSNTFIDPDGIIGRKGIITILDPESGDSRFVWAVTNAKCLTFFQSQSFLTIVKLYRNSSLVIKDINATPCFLAMNKKDDNDGSLLACTTSTQEKEVWIQTIKANIAQEG